MFKSKSISEGMRKTKKLSDTGSIRPLMATTGLESVQSMMFTESKGFPNIRQEDKKYVTGGLKSNVFR